jgi:hypothetical protein
MGRSGAYTANPSEKGEKKKKKTLVLTLGSPPEKGGEKKTLVLTMGRSGAYTANPPEKGEKKKKPWHLHWADRRKRAGKKIKNPSVNLG